jgi:hypothetical protein
VLSSVLANADLDAFSRQVELPLCYDAKLDVAGDGLGCVEPTHPKARISKPAIRWNEDDFDVLADDAVVGRIFKANASPVGASWMWTLAFGHHEDHTPL